MLSWFVRALGVGLFVGGNGCLVAAWKHFSLAALEDVYVDFHRAAALWFAPAGLLLLSCGIRLALYPAVWRQYPFLIHARFWRWLLLGWLGIFCTLGLWMPGQDLARYPCRSACVLWFALLLIPLLLPAGWRQQLGCVFQTRPGRIIDVAAGNLVLLAILLELGLRSLSLWAGQDALLLNRTTGYRLKPGVYDNGLRANSLGFADEEWTKAKPIRLIRIAALGDSFSAGTAVAHEDNYLTRLETDLGELGDLGHPGDVEVCNFGVCGTGPRDYEQLLASLVWDYQPDLVLAPIFIGNDITEWIAAPELMKFHPDSLYVELLGRRLARLVREYRRQSAEGQPADYRLGAGPQFSERTYLELTAGRLVVCRAAETRTDRERWARVQRHLEGLIADCRQHGVPVGFVLIPDEFQVNPELRRHALRLRGWQESELDLLLPQNRLTAFCAGQGIPCLDLHPAMSPEGPALHIRNDGHWNAHGHHRAAQIVAQWLRQEFPAILPGDSAHLTR